MKTKVTKPISLSTYEDVLIVPVSRSQAVIDLINEQENAKHPYTVEIKQQQPVRDNSLSRYSWKLIDQIAPICKMSSAEAYMQYLRDTPGEDIRGELSLETKSAEIWERGLTRYIKGVFKEDHLYYEYLQATDIDVRGESKTFNHYRLYLGQSNFDGKTMWAFLRNIEADAKENGIETMAEFKLRMMIEEWDKKGEKDER